MNYYGNPYGYSQPSSMDRINQQMQQLQQLQNQYQQMGMGQPQQNQPQQPANNNVAMSNRGTYVYVNDYQDVVNYPTPVDGNAVLFFNLDKGILWSKKFVNGSNSIQAFTIAPLNSVSNDLGNNTKANGENALEVPKNNEITDNMLERITGLEDKFDQIMDMLSKKHEETKQNKNKIDLSPTEKGGVDDGI